MSGNHVRTAKARFYLTAAALLVGTLLSLPTGAVAQSLIIPGSDYAIGSLADRFVPRTPPARARSDQLRRAVDEDASYRQRAVNVGEALIR